MNLILSIPLELRLALLFVAGALVGGQVNRAVHGLAFFNRRRISPWLTPDKKAPPRRWSDRLPIVGWRGMSRESQIHGRGFWVRPLLIELSLGVAFAGLYYWEIHGGLLPGALRPKPDIESTESAMLHVQCALHMTLVTLMTVATFIDFDEQIIPDEITFPGTVIGLIFAASTPLAQLPIEQVGQGVRWLDRLLVTSPGEWPSSSWIEGTAGLLCGWAICWLWCLAILPKLWYPRRGLKKARELFCAHIFRPRRKTESKLPTMPRRPNVIVLATVATMIAGPIAIAIVWSVGGTAWQGLFSSLVGLAFGGGMIWGVRIVGTYALQVEAMGFGDVTLMAMIGACLGWQPALIVFFLAPFTALIIAVAQKLFTGESHIAFGPYLCLATVILIIGWNPIWNERADEIFSLGWLVPGMVGVCLILMGVMLFVWRLIKETLFRESS